MATSLKKIIKSAPRMRGVTPVPNGPLVKKKGPYKGSTLKKGGKIRKAQDGDFLKKLGPKPDSTSSRVMSKDEVKKRTVPNKPRVETPGIITGFKKQKNGGSTPAWQRSEGKNPEGGLNAKGVASYRAANPGSKLKTAVTTKPSKLKPGSKSANRRKSFCARMSGMKKRLTSAKTANDPNSRINKSLRKWNC
jgi:hypothetical protein